MKAIVPLNVAALRVSLNDSAQVTSSFKGRTALFENMPYGSDATEASTGDKILRRLDSGSSAADALRPGVHLHWELPDYFRRGVSGQSRGIEFPPVPNRWLVARYLGIHDAGTGRYGDVRAKLFVVESDYLFASPPDGDKNPRPAITVPLPANPSPRKQPFRYMGRVLDAQSWDPGAETPSDFLSGQVDGAGKPLRLTSIGFVGPSFSSYYPECFGVFGFWDRFDDEADVYAAITQNKSIRFKVSYQVVGWIDRADADPLAGIEQLVRGEYDGYVQRCRDQNVAVDLTPADVLVQIAARKFNWALPKAGIGYTLKNDQTLDQLNAPAGTLCAGTVQEIVWDMLKNPQSVSFLGNSDAPPHANAASWSDTVEVAVGNTTVEALSALLRSDLGDKGGEPDLLENYEFVLDAFQLGLLNKIEQQGDVLIGLEESLHSRAFSQLSGGHLWTIRNQPAEADGKDDTADDGEITVAADLAQALHALNQAQKNFDQARRAVETRRTQLFMDWYRFVKMYVRENRGSGDSNDSHVTTDDLWDFIAASSGASALSTVVDAAKAAGVLSYVYDPQSGAIVGVDGPQTGDSLAQKVWQQAQALGAAVTQANSGLTGSAWRMQAVPAPSFWLPTDPVLLVEGDRIAPVLRNGRDPIIRVRLSGDLLSALKLQYKDASFTVDIAALSGKPALPAHAPPEAAAVVDEGYAIVPMLAGVVADGLARQGGAGNPAAAGRDDFIAALQRAQGGLSPADGAPATGLYETVHNDYAAAANPTQTVTTPLAITVVFTNAAGAGWAPHPVAWSAQAALPQFSASRLDPFLPAFLVWSARLDPLRRSVGRNYGPTSLTDYFDLDAVDYQYRDKVQFTRGGPVTYSGSVALSKRSTLSLSQQIDSYLADNPDDPAASDLRRARDTYNGRKILSQALSGFNVEQMLRAYVPQVPLWDLVLGEMDSVTTSIRSAITASSDDWYAGRFNSVAPIAQGPLALNNFGPLRSGFAKIAALEIVDVFGQRLHLVTIDVDNDGSLRAIAAASLAPAAADQVNAAAIYLPPRILTPTRLWFRWLSAAHNAAVGGVTGDFVEMNSHPATSPVCGWILPNHLDDSLLFYDSDGSAVGSFGIEHGTVKYRTVAGNLQNTADDLATDIGTQVAPRINPHLAAFMRRVNGAGTGFLRDLLSTVEASESFIQPASGAQDASLAALIGRPLALARAVVGLETSGGLLPLDQADTDPNDPFPQDVQNQRYDYLDRQQHSAAALDSVRFPLRLGDLPKLDDGLVGFMIDGDAANPYGTFWSSAAPPAGGNAVVRPDLTTMELTLNAATSTVTMLVDPRAPVHATIGVLPVAGLTIPPDQYARTLRRLAASFFTHPVLARRQGLIVPLPQEEGYGWSWVSPGSAAALALKAKAADEFAVYDYSPQTLLEGWLQLRPADDDSGGAGS